MIPLTIADEVQITLLDYLTTTFNLQDRQLENALSQFLSQPDGRGLFQGPYLSLRLPFKKSAEGQQGENEAPLDIAPAFRPYAHQTQAFARLSAKDGREPQPTLVTTGTGSGKTECFLYPILDHCYRQQGERGVKAIILYPMNALAADQARRLATTIWEDERLRGRITAGLYIGGSGEVAQTAMGPETLIDNRKTLRDNPPDILLTNYRMLDFLLLRPEDKPLWRFNRPETLRYLVLDELHTYDGAQGSDVACLIRRLRSRLNIAEGVLCPVGTSATVVSQSGDTSHALTDFASQIFGDDFPLDSIIGEARQTVRDFLPEESAQYNLPEPEQAGDLRTRPGETYDDYLARQLRAWFPDQAGLDPIQIADALRGHHFLHALLAAVDDAVWPVAQLCQRIGRWEPAFAAYSAEDQALVVQSFLALAAYARVQEGGRLRPFLTIQSQLWVREMSRLMRQVSDTPQFFWRDDIPVNQKPYGLPAYFCRECGHSGWLAALRDGDDHLTGDTQIIYNQYFDRHKNMRYLYPPGPQRERLLEDRLCPDCLGISPREICDACQKTTIPVAVHRELSQSQKQRDLQRCPVCATDGSLGILGRQAASLLSVAISHLFTSPRNQEKKLLAFTDSVQDASHRAAFFGARTYRFNLRAAFQAALEAVSAAETVSSAAVDVGVPSIRLDQFTDALLAYWKAHWEEESAPEERLRVGQKLAATFMPPDLQEMTAYRQYMDERAQPMPANLERDLRRRLSWEVTAEYGFNARVGRSLEKVGSSTAYIPRAVWLPALEKLQFRLPEEFSLLKGTSPQTIVQFVLGLLERARLRGGVGHELLRQYAGDQGNWFLLTKKRQPLLSPFGKHSPRFPRFLIDVDTRGVFDQFVTRGSQATWFVDWARRTLSPDLGISDINEIYRLTLPLLAEGGLLQTTTAGQSTVYGLDPAALYLTAETAILHCDVCGQQQTVTPGGISVWQGMSCLNFRCTGHYQPLADTGVAVGRSYYRDLYARGQVARIYSQEHTGLLERGRREAIEIEFKRQTRADAPNLLTATPTLEMGIDIGDLSATLACAIPPTTANYLQRIGRAGRATGNSFILALANVKPHDLTYFEQPLEMIAGAITPPGCYLDAPKMLQRQFLAFTMDTWAAFDPQASELPRTVKDMLARLKQNNFPLNLLAFYNQHKERLIGRFLSMFGPVISAHNQAWLRELTAGDDLPNSVMAAVEAAIEERERLRNNHKALRREQAQIKEKPAQYENPEKRVADLEQEMRLINATIKALEDKYILNFFTDAGLLPNYAFPETGVTLTAVITGIEAAQEEKRYRVKKYLRPAPVAIRELAPFNTFYAEGRKLTINNVNLRGQETGVERWQFCTRCAYMSSVSVTHYSTVCPQCSSEMWHDAGQQHDMARLREVTARTDHQQSLSGDDGEERQTERYETGLYFSVDAAKYSEGAHLIPSLPFGFEALQQVTLREINFGLRSSYGHQLQVAGEDKPESGFQICPGCGVVADSRQNEEQKERIVHAMGCSLAKSQQKGKTAAWHNLYFYREMTSEALRILLPVSTVLIDEKLATFQACLYLGLRRKFKGEPDHIRIAPATEVTPDGARRRFLMMYDTVPGGTSYLRDLAQPAVFRELLTLALETLVSCPCRSNSDKQACYRCLYAYHSQYDKELISRQRGVEMLQETLAQWPEMISAPTLSGADMVSLVESELEQRFVDALQTAAQKRGDMQWQMKLHQGKEAWLLTVGQRQWLVEPQVTLGQWHGVSLTSRPDFVFWPQGRQAQTARPVAVFTDGLAYHVQPERMSSRLADDVAKRSALLDSGKFWVWSVTWDDVQDFADETAFAQPYLTPERYNALRTFAQRDEKIRGLETAARSDGVGQLLLYLSQPEAEIWRNLAEKLALSLMVPPHPPAAEQALLGLNDLLISSGQRPLLDLSSHADEAGTHQYGIAENESWQLLTYIPQRALSQGNFSELSLALRLDDVQTNRSEPHFRNGWRQFWLLFNLAQFLSGFTAVTSETIQMQPTDGSPVGEAAAASSAADSVPDDWTTAFEYALPECEKLLAQALAANLSPPIVGYELLDAKERVVGMAELAWVKERTAVFLPEQAEDAILFGKADWRVFTAEETDDILNYLKGIES